MTRKKSTKKMSTAQKVGIGVSLTAAAVAAAGTYFLYGSKNAKDNRKKVKSWMLKAKAEILETLEKAEHMTEEEYTNLINTVLATYGKAEAVTKKELKDFEKEMKENWEHLLKSTGKKKKAASKKKPTKTASKKAATKKKSAAKK